MGGGGMVATRHISCGSVIARDYPLILITAKEMGVSDVCSKDNQAAQYDTRHAAIKQHFDQLSSDDQAAVLALADTQTNNRINRAMVDSLYKDGIIQSEWKSLYSLTSVPADFVV